jgi:hypothetical protein
MLEELHEREKPMARYADDQDLNSVRACHAWGRFVYPASLSPQMLKSVIHADDPMAEYMMKQRSRERAAAGIVGA